MNNNLSNAIQRYFDKHRIVFWYDEKSELRHEYESLSLPGVEKIELHNDEFAVKYRILRAQPDQKFLIYQYGPKPVGEKNWLLDVLLANVEFSADQISLWMNELGLAPGLWNLVQEHFEFFTDEHRRYALKARLAPDDDGKLIRTKMLAVCVDADIDNRTESVLEVLLDELAQDGSVKFELIRQCNLDAFLWNRIEVQFGYVSAHPGVKDFAITLFRSCYFAGLDSAADKSPALTQDAVVFLKRWRDSVRHRAAFETLSNRCADILGIERDLQTRDLRTLVEIDFFLLIDQKILSALAQQILARTLSAGDCAKIIWRRRSTHWYAEFENHYEALSFASQFMSELDAADLHLDSLADGIRKYQNTWYRLDRLYRKFVYHVRLTRSGNLLAALSERLDNLYSNNFLRPLTDRWQPFVDAAPAWDIPPFPRQSQFFERYIAPYLDTKNKVAVIISDALRYEIGQELVTLIEQGEGYSAESEPMLAMLPGYTQLGMAALLPHKTLTLLPDGNVQVDGQLSAGLENRTKILAGAVEKGSIALRAEDLLAMNRDTYREVTRGAQVVYVYHNRIDHTGDDKMSETQVFDAVETAFQEIRLLLKKLHDSYFANVIVTADHGFIYQNQSLDESEFSLQDAAGDEIQFRNRRFVIGKGLESNPSFKRFDAAALGLTGDYQVLLPKSISRLRVQGSGSRYVHGGASLQEILLPVIQVNKKRSQDVSLVEVDVITSSSSIITSGQLSIAFYQTEPISPKLQPRILRAGIFSADDVLLSDSHTLTFDFTSENPREREVRQQFVLSSKAEAVNNQTVYLKLEEPVQGTTHHQVYKSFDYQLRKSFTVDFDF